MDLFIDFAAIILSIVATVLTVIGFFASLRFYRDGVELQTRVQNLLSRIEEKVGSLQAQMGGMFDKTLDAAIGRMNLPEAAEAQERLLKETHVPVPAEQAAGAPDGDNLAQDVMELMAFRGLRYTDVSSDDARAIFSLGSRFLFNLFDATGDIRFFGYFHREDYSRVASRLGLLLANIRSAYERIEASDNEAREAARELLDQISVTVLVSPDIDPDELVQVVAPHQPRGRQIDIEVLTPDLVRTALQEQQERFLGGGGEPEAQEV